MNSYKAILINSLLIMSLLSCRTEEGNEKLGDASQKAGTSAATIVKNVKAGIEKVSKINIEISDNLKNRGVSTGKIDLSSKGGRHNVINVYMIFDKKFNRNVTLKATNSQGLEVGRSKVLVTADEGDAKIIDFLFDKRTNIDRDYKIVME